jgi:3-dehydroquinate synthase
VSVVDALGYPIVVETGALERLSALVGAHARAHRYAIVTDETVARHHLAPVRTALATSSGNETQCVVIPPGEAHKTRAQWASITDALLAAGHGRDTAIVALGGGVIGDLAGFVAATYMRGIPVVQIPTTLLAMVDASIGGKTAVDTPAGKNTVGAFHPPMLVVIDPSTLGTLPARELRAGFAEVIKHGVIADASELDLVMSLAPLVTSGAGASDRSFDALIERSVRIKASVVAADERELGQRKVLNFGHTVGHGVESASDYTLLHGEAIAIGMVAEARVAERVGVADHGTAATIERAVTAIGLPTRISSGIAATRVLELMQSDKKRRRGVVEFALPQRVGAMAGSETAWGIAVDTAQVQSVLSELIEA